MKCKFTACVLILMSILLFVSCKKIEKSNEKETIQICVDYAFKELANCLIDTWEHIQSDFVCELIIIPENKDEAEVLISQIRVEIMAGRGPDVFIMSGQRPGFDEEEKVYLFDNPEKLMYSNLFYDVEDLLYHSNTVSVEKLNSKILESGKTSEGQMLVPICYSYKYKILKKEAEQNIANSWDEQINYTDSLVKDSYKKDVLLSFHKLLNPIYNYSTGQFDYKENEFYDIFDKAYSFVSSETFEETKDDSIEIIAEGDMTGLRYIQNFDNQNMCFAGTYNLDDGITAEVWLYAAINRNSQNPTVAFSFLELMLRDDIMCGNGFTIDGKSYGYQISDILTMISAPIHKDAHRSMFSNLSDQSYEALLQYEEQINQVRYYSNIDRMLQDVFFQYVNIKNDSDRKQILESTWDSMQKMFLE